MKRRSILGSIGLLLGGFALIVAVVSHFAGPFAPEPTLAESFRQTAAELRAAMEGEEPDSAQPFYADWDIDRRLAVGSGITGGLAVVLGFLALARREDLFVAGSAIALGALTVVFQLVTAGG